MNFLLPDSKRRTANQAKARRPRPENSIRGRGREWGAVCGLCAGGVRSNFPRAAQRQLAARWALSAASFTKEAAP